MSKAKQNKKHSVHINQKAESKKVAYPVKFVWGVVIAIIAFLLYSNTIGHDYALDDSGAITGNRYVQEGFSGIFKLLKVDFWHFANVHLGYYRPLALITFAIEQHFFHGNPHISHFINCLIFAFSGFTLFIVLSKIFNSANSIFPFIVTLLFIAHPIQTQLVKTPL
jgi:ABC-type siderophore export system fused ATPase/permease subunit